MNQLFEYNYNSVLFQERNELMHCGHLRFDQWQCKLLFTTGYTTFLNESSDRLTFWRLGISKIPTIFFNHILSNVTIQGCLKLSCAELMDVRFGRSTLHHFKSFH